MCWLSVVVRSPPARRSLSWIQSLMIELWLLGTEVSTLSLILLTTQTMVTRGILPLQGKISMVEQGIEPGTSWLVVRISDHQTTRLVVNRNKCIENNLCITLVIYQETLLGALSRKCKIKVCSHSGTKEAKQKPTRLEVCNSRAELLLRGLLLPKIVNMLWYSNTCNLLLRIQTADVSETQTGIGGGIHLLLCANFYIRYWTKAK